MNDKTDTNDNRPYVGYIRVSTRSQGKAGVGILRQKAGLEKYAQLKGRTLDRIFDDVSSGAQRDRPRLREAIERTKSVNGVLLIESSSRLARDAEFAKWIREEEGIQVEQLDMDRWTTEEGQEALDQAAEEERQEIMVRSQRGRQRAKKAGIRFGSGTPRAGGIARGKQMTKNSDDFAKLMLPIIDALAHELGKKPTLAYIAAKLNEFGHQTRKGANWTPMTVSRIISKREKMIAAASATPTSTEATTATLGETTSDYSDNPLWGSWRTADE